MLSPLNTPPPSQYPQLYVYSPVEVECWPLLYIWRRVGVGVTLYHG